MMCMGMDGPCRAGDDRAESWPGYGIGEKSKIDRAYRIHRNHAKDIADGPVGLRQYRVTAKQSRIAGRRYAGDERESSDTFRFLEERKRERCPLGAEESDGIRRRELCCR